MTPTYAQLQPLIVREITEGRTVAVVFRCPESGERVASRAAMAADGGGIRHLAETSARETTWALRRELGRAVGSMVGGGFLGQVARDQVDRAVQGATHVGRDRVFDDGDREEAVVRAFLAVRDRFRWDGSRWVAAHVATPRFPTAPAGALPAPGPDRRLPDAVRPEPVRVTAPVDVEAVAASDAAVLLRMLVEVANADGQIGAEERAMFEAIGDDVDPDALRSLPPLTPADLAGVSEASRERLYQTAAAMALSDKVQAASESALLERYREGFGFPRARQAELERKAREQLVEILVRDAWSGGTPTSEQRDRVRSEALRLGVPPIRVQQIEQKVGG